MVTRIGTFTNQQMILSATLRNQARFADTQLQVATGKVSQTFSGISQDTSRLTNLKNELAKTEQYIENIDVVTKRLEFMEFGLEQIDDMARDMRSLIRSNLNGDAATTVNLQALAQQYLEQVTEIMNLRDDSRYLFAGGKTDTKPVDLANGVYTPPVPPPFDATADTGYYEGDASIAEVRIDDTVVVQYGVLASESAFEKIIRALDHVAQTTFTSPITAAEKQMLNDAITALTEAVEDNGTSKTIGELASDVVLDHRLLDSQREKHQQYANFASTSIGEIENVDTAEAITFLNFQQVQLQASYELIARIGTLSLTNFLR
jgi:flagellar hook-associated protein 3 FlgL